MPTARPDDRLEIPMTELAGARRDGRRAIAATAAIVVVLGGAFGLARLSEPSRSAASPSAIAPLERSPGAASGGPTAPDGVSPGPSAARRSVGPRVEALPDIARVALPGSPEVTLVERSGVGLRDLRIRVWTPDDARVRTTTTFAAALPTEDVSAILPLVAPDRRHAILIIPSGRPAVSADSARLVGPRGPPLWSTDGVMAASGGVWSSDSRTVVVAGQPRTWWIVRLARGGGTATGQKVTLPPAIFLPTQMPYGSLSPLILEPRTVPLGFSADGSWIYGGVISPETGILFGQFRVSSDGATVEALPDFRVGERDGLVPRSGTVGSRTVDPSSGRVVSARINGNTTGGPVVVQVRGPDAAHLFTVDAPVTIGVEWGEAGGLYALISDKQIFPDRVDLVRYDPDGHASDPLFTTGSLTSASLVGVRDGYAVIGLLATRPAFDARIVAVDLADPSRATALPFGTDPSVVLIAAGLDR
jgi:hypothetical protein